MGLLPGDIHLNISSPGWAKHAYSCFFAPWNAGATVFINNTGRFNARALLDAIVGNKVTTLCAPPTVWRMLIQEDLKSARHSLREVLAAGEPLNPEVIEQVRVAWGLTIRDFYGQTETSAQIGNPPGQLVKSGSMGRALPGFRIRLLDEEDQDAPEGEVSIALDPPPAGLMLGYQQENGSIAGLTGAAYRTGDVASIDADGYLTYVGRADDVFKASDYRISPFELESVLIEHPAVAEAAVVPAPDPMRLAVPKAYLALVAGGTPDRATALSIFQHLRARLSPFKRVRRLEFYELPKTISRRDSPGGTSARGSCPRRRRVAWRSRVPRGGFFRTLRSIGRQVDKPTGRRSLAALLSRRQRGLIAAGRACERRCLGDQIFVGKGKSWVAGLRRP